MCSILFGRGGGEHAAVGVIQGSADQSALFGTVADMQTASSPLVDHGNQSPLIPSVLIDQLINPSSRENALMELSRCREGVPDLAILLWDTPGRIY